MKIYILKKRELISFEAKETMHCDSQIINYTYTVESILTTWEFFVTQSNFQKYSF